MKLGEKTHESKPLWSIIIFTFGVLSIVAFIDYSPEQSPWMTTSAYDEMVQNLVGVLGVALAFWCNYLFGISAWVLPLIAFWSAYLLMFRKIYLFTLTRYIGFAFFPIACCGIFNIAEQYFITHPYLLNNRIFPYGPSGLLGQLIYTKFLHKYLGVFGSSLVFLVMLALALVLSFSLYTSLSKSCEQIYFKFFRIIGVVLKKIFIKGMGSFKSIFERKDKKSLPSIVGAEQATFSSQGKKGVERQAIEPLRRPEVESASASETNLLNVDKRVASENEKQGFSRLIPEKLKIFASEKVYKSDTFLPEKKGDYIFPSRVLLNESPDCAEISAQEHQETADALVRTLSEFGVEVHPGEVHTGPVITRYEVTPAPGVRVEKIVNLDKNLALSLKAHSIRILAPVPGKGSVGIEIPNRKPTPVCLREIIESTAWTQTQAEIPIVLGKEVTGKPLVYDLTKMPHLLIAGSTGSGKTVCINTIIASLLYRASPNDIRFLMVDPKIVEMQLYNTLPHMLIPVVTEPKKVPSALKWLIKEMEHRYQIFASLNVRNIAGFNSKVLKDKKENLKAQELEAALSPEERAALNNIEVPRDTDIEIPKEKLPYIVCVVDELADLMMVAPADIETCIARLAQLARAAGIHLILATQRPSVNVITGVIKANLPSRIAFKVASKVDSRTILDIGGADQLIGRGDMLFIPPGTSNLVRAQGAYVSDDEINGIVEALKVNGPPCYADDVQRQIDLGEDAQDQSAANLDWEDDMVPAAIEVIRNSKRASTSMLQRRLKIGYNRAARIMEILEAEGIVGPENGQNPREIIKDLEVV